MKKLFFGLLAATIITSCSTDEQTQNQALFSKTDPAGNELKITLNKAKLWVESNGEFTTSDSLHVVLENTPPLPVNDNKMHVYHLTTSSGSMVISGNINFGILYDDVTGCYSYGAWHSPYGNNNVINSYTSDNSCHGWAWAYWHSIID